MQTNEILTRRDLDEFRLQLIQDLREFFQPAQNGKKQWLRSSEVRKILGISHGTLQNLRVNGTLPFTRIGSIVFYRMEDIERTLEENSVRRKVRGRP